MAAVRSSDGFPQIGLVELEPDEVHAELDAGEGGRAQAEKRIRDQRRALAPVQSHAHLRQLRWKGGGCGRSLSRLWIVS